MRLRAALPRPSSYASMALYSFLGLNNPPPPQPPPPQVNTFTPQRGSRGRGGATSPAPGSPASSPIVPLPGGPASGFVPGPRRAAKRGYFTAAGYLGLFALVGASLWASWTGVSFVHRDGRGSLHVPGSGGGSDESLDEVGYAPSSSWPLNLLSATYRQLEARSLGFHNPWQEHVEPAPELSIDGTETEPLLPFFESPPVAGEEDAEDNHPAEKDETTTSSASHEAQQQQEDATTRATTHLRSSPSSDGGGGGNGGGGKSSSSNAKSGDDSLSPLPIRIEEKPGSGDSGEKAAVDKVAHPKEGGGTGPPVEKPAPVATAAAAAQPGDNVGKDGGGGGPPISAASIKSLDAARPLFGLPELPKAAPPPVGDGPPSRASSPSPPASPGPSTVLAELAALEGPETPELAAERVALGSRRSPLGPRIDIQILRDLAPWREAGFTLEDVLATRAHHAPLIDRVANFSSGMITTIIKRGVPYMLEAEVKTAIGTEYGIGSKGKIRAFGEMLAAVHRVFPLPDVYFIWNVHPWPLLRTGSGSSSGGGGGSPGGFSSAIGDVSTGSFGSRQRARPAPRGVVPVLSLCKTDTDLDVLYPNMYFQSPQYWWRATRSLERASRNWPWSRRRGRMWWRGASGWMWPAAAPRVLTLARWHDKPWADLAFTNPWGSQLRDWTRTKEPFRFSLPRRVKKIPYGTDKRTTMEAVAKSK